LRFENTLCWANHGQQCFRIRYDRERAIRIRGLQVRGVLTHMRALWRLPSALTDSRGRASADHPEARGRILKNRPGHLKRLIKHRQNLAGDVKPSVRAGTRARIELRND
jgi:hypothetical protein